MKKYKCPDCGKEFSEGSTMPVECPICGCPFEKFEMIEIIEETQNVKYCSHCGKPLPLHNVKFCPECGCNLTAQPTKDYDVICPDCNSVITDENSDCPNCGCPPSEFKRHIKEKEHHKPKTQKKSGASQALIIICILALIGGVGLYYKNKNEAEEKAQQEQYQKEQQELQEQRERVEREQREQEEAAEAKRRQEEEAKNNRRKGDLCRNKWVCTHGDPYGECILETVGFETDGTAWNSMIYYVGGNRIKSSSFDFTYHIDGDYIYVQGEKAYYYDGHSLELWPSGQRLKEVSRLDF
jgi:DNA-directed RNA polymerase subunit RPC12/RpoP